MDICSIYCNYSVVTFVFGQDGSKQPHHDIDGLLLFAIWMCICVYIYACLHVKIFLDAYFET